jgi:hypothetical protein
VSKTGIGIARRASGIPLRAAYIIILAFITSVATSQINKASAQTASFRSVDTNSDGVLSVNELTAEFGEPGARRLLEEIDSNGDDRITIIELRRGVDNGRSEKNERGDRREDGDRENDDDRSDGRNGDDRGDDRDDDGDDRGDDD